MNHSALRLIGAGALIASGLIHLQQYFETFHAVATIGPLFLVNIVAALLAGSLLLIRRDAPLVMAGLAIAGGTLAAYIVSTTVGLFGFVSATGPIEILAAVTELLALGTLGTLLAMRQRTG